MDASHLQHVFLLIAAIALFFAPTWLAAKGRRTSIFLVNAFFGLTVIGWGIALIMAVRSQENAK